MTWSPKEFPSSVNPLSNNSLPFFLLSPIFPSQKSISIQILIFIFKNTCSCGLYYSLGVQFSLNSQYPYLPYQNKSLEFQTSQKRLPRRVSFSLDSHAISISFAPKQILKISNSPKRLPRRVPHSLNSNEKFPCKSMKFFKLNNWMNK